MSAKPKPQFIRDSDFNSPAQLNQDDDLYKNLSITSPGDTDHSDSCFRVSDPFIPSTHPPIINEYLLSSETATPKSKSNMSTASLRDNSDSSIIEPKTISRKTFTQTVETTQTGNEMEIKTVKRTIIEKRKTADNDSMKMKALLKSNKSDKLDMESVKSSRSSRSHKTNHRAEVNDLSNLSSSSKPEKMKVSQKVQKDVKYQQDVTKISKGILTSNGNSDLDMSSLSDSNLNEKVNVSKVEFQRHDFSPDSLRTPAKNDQVQIGNAFNTTEFSSDWRNMVDISDSKSAKKLPKDSSSGISRGSSQNDKINSSKRFKSTDVSIEKKIKFKDSDNWAEFQTLNSNERKKSHSKINPQMISRASLNRLYPDSDALPEDKEKLIIHNINEIMRLDINSKKEHLRLSGRLIQNSCQVLIDTICEAFPSLQKKSVIELIGNPTEFGLYLKGLHQALVSTMTSIRQQIAQLQLQINDLQVIMNQSDLSFETQDFVKQAMSRLEKQQKNLSDAHKNFMKSLST